MPQTIANIFWCFPNAMAWMIRSFKWEFPVSLFPRLRGEHKYERWARASDNRQETSPPPTALTSIINQLSPDKHARISEDETQSVPSVEWWQHIDSDCLADWLTAKRVSDSGIIFTCAFISSNILPEFLSTWLLKSSSASSACWACCFWTSESFCTWSSRSL